VKTYHVLALVILIPLLAPDVSLAQGYAGDQATVELYSLIDKPTAGMLRKGSYAIWSNLYEQGGVLAGVSVGLFDRFSFGISYGGTDIIGHNKIQMNPLPGVNVKLRLFEESVMMPAIAIGFDSQGKEPYLDSLKRYTIKSPGFFAVGSKNYAILGNLSIHGGINYSLEHEDGDKDLDVFVGVEKSIGNTLSFLAEYDFAANDNHFRAIGQGNGYLNLGLRFSAGGGLVIGFDLKDVSQNQRNVKIGNRVVQIDYVGSF
jgi:hypothetical protein